MLLQKRSPFLFIGSNTGRMFQISTTVCEKKTGYSASSICAPTTAQAALIADARVDGSGDDIYLGTVFAGLQWTQNDTRAPAATAASTVKWHSYVFPKRKISQRSGFNYFNYSGGAAVVAQHTFSVEGSAVSVPGLSTYLGYNGMNAANTTNPPGVNLTALTGDDPDQVRAYDWSNVDYSSGIDCSGFAHRISKYSGSTYWVAASDSKYGTRTFAGEIKQGDEWIPQPVHSGSFQIHPGNWKLDTKVPSEFAQRDLDRAMISRAVPGDILVIGGEHVVIIQNIRIPAGSDVITSYDQVDVIHATSGGLANPGQWRVQHDTWENIGNNRASYQLRRYR
jgi:hypothetical protein